MSIGENIYRLRTKKGLSQAALGDLLGVSRQSISKWETGASIPDLEKLIKLSEIFAVSLDELVGKAPKEPYVPLAAENPLKKVEPYPTRKSIGFVLLGFSLLLFLVCLFLGDLLAAIALSIPVFGCSLICLFAEKHPLLWCLWILYFFFSLVYQRVLFAGSVVSSLLWWITTLLLIAFTGFSFRKTIFPITRKHWILLFSGWGTCLIFLFLMLFAGSFSFPWLAVSRLRFLYLRALTTLSFGASLPYTFCFIRSRRARRIDTDIPVQ